MSVGLVSDQRAPHPTSLLEAGLSRGERQMPKPTVRGRRQVVLEEW